jgi:biotin synthase
MISAIRDLGLLPCASLGMLNAEELSRLKAAGLDRYHHNLETSRRFYKKICSTHGYTEKIETVKAALASGLSICSGGIFGMGETWQDRIDMAFALRRLNVDSVPINFLIPIKGTSLESRELLNPLDALQIIALYRFILPNKEIRICGGRLQVLNEFHPLIFLAGADSLLTGNYLTTFGRVPADDVGLINLCGLTLRGPS